MAHYRASESKREQFRRYLEKSGVLDTITSVLVALYEETDKPNNALEVRLTDVSVVHTESSLSPEGNKPLLLVSISTKFDPSGFIKNDFFPDVDLNHLHSFVKLHLGAGGPEPVDTEALRMELSDLQQKCNLLMEENKELRNRLLQYEPSPEEGAAE